MHGNINAIIIIDVLGFNAVRNMHGNFQYWLLPVFVAN